MTGRSAARLFRPLFVLIGLGLLAAPPAQAQRQDTPAIETRASHAYMIDTTTGAVLLEKNAEAPMHPASMSKLMTVYLVFERLKRGELHLDDTLPVSEKAWRMGGSKMFVEVNSRVAVEDLLQGVIVQSGNDACIVLAEALAGTEAAFAELMTAKAKALGLANSHFANATGWPDDNHLMSARDIAALSQHLITDFPAYYHYFAEKTFTYNGIKQGNRNPLLYRNMGADGLKTGHTEASGYGLVASAKRGDRRLILVVNGLSSVRERATESERLLEWGFRSFKNYHLFDRGQVVGQAKVWLGAEPEVDVVIDRDLTVTLPRQARSKLSVALVQEGPAPAPVAAGDEIARLEVSAPGIEPMTLPLSSTAAVERLGLFGRLRAALEHLIWGAAG